MILSRSNSLPATGRTRHSVLCYGGYPMSSRCMRVIRLPTSGSNLITRRSTGTGWVSTAFRYFRRSILHHKFSCLSIFTGHSIQSSPFSVFPLALHTKAQEHASAVVQHQPHHEREAHALAHFSQGPDRPQRTLTHRHRKPPDESLRCSYICTQTCPRLVQVRARGI